MELNEYIKTYLTSIGLNPNNITLKTYKSGQSPTESANMRFDETMHARAISTGKTSETKAFIYEDDTKKQTCYVIGPNGYVQIGAWHNGNERWMVFNHQQGVLKLSALYSLGRYETGSDTMNLTIEDTSHDHRKVEFSDEIPVKPLVGFASFLRDISTKSIADYLKELKEKEKEEEEAAAAKAKEKENGESR